MKSTPTQAFDRRFDSGEDISDLVDWSKGRRLHGGHRQGSGRKPIGRKAYTIRLHPDIHDLARAHTKRKGITLSQYIEELLTK